MRSNSPRRAAPFGRSLTSMTELTLEHRLIEQAAANTEPLNRGDECTHAEFYDEDANLFISDRSPTEGPSEVSSRGHSRRNRKKQTPIA